jgi:hypothetical protein
VANGDEDNILKNKLSDSFDQKKNQKTVLQAVLDCSEEWKKWSKIKASQWGQVRNIATGSTSFNELQQKLFCKEEGKKGFLMKGKARDQWEGKVVIFEEKIKDLYAKTGDEFAIQFVIKIASEMGKIASKKGGDDE